MEKVKLWDHQKAIVNTAKDRTHYALFCEQGTGKTLTTITLLREIYSQNKKALKTLILCPAIVVNNWAEEFDRFSLCGDLVQPLIGPKAKRIEALKASGKKIFVTNFEALDMDGLFWEKKGKVKKLIDHGFEVLVVDEAHRFRNKSAQRTKMAIRMAKTIYYRYLLTGTPILKDAQDIWSQFMILDLGETFGDNFFHFRNKYFIDDHAGMPTQKYFPSWRQRPGIESELNDLIYRKAFRVTKEECLDLPPLIERTINVEMSREQKRHYDEMKADFVTYLKSDACVASMAMVKAMRLQQIVSGYLKLDTGEEHSFDATPRLAALQDLLEDNQGARSIIWASWRPNYAVIGRILEKMGLTYMLITGEQNHAEKMRAVAAFQAGELDCVVCNPGAAGTGVTLTASNLSFWYSRTFNLEHRLQALARNHRGGSEIHKKVTSIDLVTPNSIDVAVLEALQAKQDVAKSILSWRDKV